MAAVRRKRVLVPPERQKGSYQPRLDHVMLVMAHQVRAAILEFLSHARLLGDSLQSFSAIQHAIESKNKRLSTSDLDYHLKALLKAQLIEKITNGDESAGYMLTERGRNLTEKYLEMREIHVDVPELERNVLENHVHEIRIMSLTRPVKQESHITCIELSPRLEVTITDRYLANRAREVLVGKQASRPVKPKQKPSRDVQEKKTAGRKAVGGFSNLDDFF